MRAAWQWFMAFLDVNYCESYWQTVQERDAFFYLLYEAINGNSKKISRGD
jgi:hypothetical protein